MRNSTFLLGFIFVVSTNFILTCYQTDMFSLEEADITRQSDVLKASNVYFLLEKLPIRSSELSLVRPVVQSSFGVRPAG